MICCQDAQSCMHVQWGDTAFEKSGMTAVSSARSCRRPSGWESETEINTAVLLEC